MRKLKEPLVFLFQFFFPFSQIVVFCPQQGVFRKHLP